CGASIYHNVFALFTQYALSDNALELPKPAFLLKVSFMSTATAPRTEPVAHAADGGDPAALLARTQDLSRRLHEREEFYRSVLESLGEGILITDRENRILYANSSVECMTGYSRTELLGAVSHELLTPRTEWPAM